MMVSLQGGRESVTYTSLFSPQSSGLQGKRTVTGEEYTIRLRMQVLLTMQ